jgi:nucleoside-diphosphate-sugar epimerase
MVFGPVLDARHLRSSPALLHQLVTGRMKGCPRLAFPVVDVRDVAEAHVRALEAERPSRRYLCVASTRWYADLARMIRSALPDVPVATRQLPDWIILAASLFDRRIGFTYMRNNLGKFPRFSNERIRSELGLAFRPIEETIADAARSIVDGGWS